MSNVYKRPMFRRGGNTNMNGIMSGIEDRKNYANGPEMPSVNSSAPSITNKQDSSYEETVRKIMDEYESKRVNPIYKLAIQGGLRGMSERRGGSVAANLAKAFEGPTDQLFKDLDAKRAMERDV